MDNALQRCIQSTMYNSDLLLIAAGMPFGLYFASVFDGHLNTFGISAVKTQHESESLGV